MFIFALAPETLDSTACTLEREYATALRKTILPVQVADGVSINLLPKAVSQRQFVNYDQQDRSAIFDLSNSLLSVPAGTFDEAELSGD